MIDSIYPAGSTNAGGDRESMAYDVVIVGGGPAGLSAAIRLKQLAVQAGMPLQVCVLEKGSEIGAHIVSGAVMDPKALIELIPDWQALGAPLHTQVTEDRFLFLSKHKAVRVPNALLPDGFKNHGNYVVSLANVARWLAQQAETLGVDIFSGLSAAEVLYNTSGAVAGVITGDMGVGKNRKPTENFQPGIELRGRYTLFCEGARGHLGKRLIARFKLDEHSEPQVYGLGIKEVWEVEPSRHSPGLVIHTAGWPLQSDTYGGSFLYHSENNQVVVGFVVGLGYTNPYLSPFEEFQRYKTHPAIRSFLEGGKRLSYGARAITAGGLLSLPKLVFPGGALVGCEAGFLNTSRIKGSHSAIHTGKLAAEAAFDALQQGREGDELLAYPQAFRTSWLHDELHRARNFKQWMSKGLWLGSLMVGLEQKVLGGRFPWNLGHIYADHQKLKPAARYTPISYPRPDGLLTFDRLSSIYLANTHHEENQPTHLTLKNLAVPVNVNLALYQGPEARYCPAGVYDFIETESGESALIINGQNCIHCKTCDIKDPTQNIEWVTPEGGGGPNYSNM